MIKDIKELNLPSYATLDTATVAISDMGDRTITAQVKIDGSVVPDFSYDWEVEFDGERYIHPIREPQGVKDNASLSSKVDMVFYHWAIYEMKREYFVEMASTSAGTAVPNKYITPLGLNLGDFVTAFNLVLNHYYDGEIIINLNPEWQYDQEAKFVSISYSYIWDVLQQMHEVYGVRWTLKTNDDGVCEILMGYPAEEVSHIFEYGFEGGLLSVQRQVQSTDIRNRLLGRGGEKNLPRRYFKDVDPNNPLFMADPDWIPELANIAFTELRGKTFRDYVKGWKASRYGGSAMSNPTEAYLAGYNAEKFDPIEYVEDSVSVDKYGILTGALENNDEIYPSIQNAPSGVDILVDAEQVTDDDVDDAVENDSVVTNLESWYQMYRNAPANSTVTITTLTKRSFSVPSGKVGNLDMSITVKGNNGDQCHLQTTFPRLNSYTITLYGESGSVVGSYSSLPIINIPAGNYDYEVSAEVESNHAGTSMITLNMESVNLYTSTPGGSQGWTPTFDVWVGNIWGTSRDSNETDEQYADRVWAPILGDRAGNEASVVFASGLLSFSSDWEFPIIGYAFDDSKSGSHWRLTLAKSEAELEASGKYIPYEGYNASAGDRFFFIGIDMPYEYVLWAEERLDNYKRDALLNTANINPAWVIKTDKVRLNKEEEDEEGNITKLLDSIKIGSQIRLASKQFISGAYETLYIQSITYNWTAGTIMFPDIEVVVSDKVYASKNPVAQIQGDIETIQRQVGSLSNIQQIVRQISDMLYLRKDGIEDVSKSPTKFLGKITGEKFRQGQIGGRDWGIYRDENGNAIFEADKIVARQGVLVNDLVINEATYVGGIQINSAAALKVSLVEDSASGYVCYFDPKQGTVANKFKVDDVALCQRFDAEQNEIKFYKRRVVAVTDSSVTLSNVDDDVNGTGVPAIEDEIIHFGNYTDKSRQFVIIRDVIGGGYERMLMDLNSVTATGLEYYFAGKSADNNARWFVGSTEQYAKFENGQFTIKGNLFVTGSDKPIGEQIADLDYIREALGDGAQGLVLGTAIIVGYNDEQGNFVPMAGMSGIYDKESENGGPAAWYGGTPDNAKSVVFMDGTGYFADGLFKWDLGNGVNLGNDAIKINYDGSVEFGENIKISTEGDETLGSVLTALAKLNDWFEWADEDHTAIKTKYDFFSERTVASGGKATDDGGEPQGVIILDAWGNYDASLPQVLGALLGLELHNRLTAVESGSVTPDLSSYATIEYVTRVINELVDGAPEALNTLKEIADVLEGNVDSIGDILLALEQKASKEELAVVAGLVNEQGDAIAALDGRVATLEEKDDMFRWVTDADGTRRIETDYDFASMRTVASGGVGEQGEILGGGIQAVQVNGALYDDPNEDGVIELPDLATKGEHDALVTEVANVEDRTGAVEQEVDNLVPRVDGHDSDIDGLKLTDAAINEKLGQLDWLIGAFSPPSENNGTIVTPFNFASQGSIASLGIGEEGSGESDSSTLDGLLDVTIDFTSDAPTEENRQVLAYDVNKAEWTNKRTMYKHTQGTASNLWTIQHNLNKVPNVKIIDSTGEQVFGTVKIGDANGSNPMNIIRVAFGGAFAGTAYLD